MRSRGWGGVGLSIPPCFSLPGFTAALLVVICGWGNAAAFSAKRDCCPGPHIVFAWGMRGGRGAARVFVARLIVCLAIRLTSQLGCVCKGGKNIGAER